jgi:hypothetical protein
MGSMGICSNCHGHKKTKTIGFFDQDEHNGRPDPKSKLWNKKNKNKNTIGVK